MATTNKSKNILATTNPKLAAEWHYEKNYPLKPTDVTISSGKKVWWLYPYDDPVTSEHFDFEWQATIVNRNKCDGCPFLTNHALWSGFNDLETVNPKLAKQLHPTKNGNLKANLILGYSNKKVWWLLPYDDSKTGKHFDFEWQATISSRNSGTGCPYLSNPAQATWAGFNDLATTNPELAKEWHPTKNGNLKPIDVTANSGKKVWWLLPYDDPKTGKHFDFEWQATIADRNMGRNCPYLADWNTRVLKGFNDLYTKNPKLCKELHPIKNGNLNPTEILANSGQKVWWLYSYDDPKTGKHFDFEWQATIASRNQGVGCPFLSTNARLWQGFNDLATVNPELAKQWHPVKNGNLYPTEIVAGSDKKIWWLLPYDDLDTGKHFDFEWQATISNRNQGEGCPYLTGIAVWAGFNDLATVNPELAKQWHPIKNGNLKPIDVMANSRQKVWWLYSYDDPKTGKHFNFEWQAQISSRNHGNGCPFLTSSKTEVIIYQYLDKNKIDFVPEKVFNDCVYKNKLLFDIFVINEDIIIECDGLQHFQSVKGWGGEKALEITCKRDNIKTKYCKDNGIALLRIPYIYDPDTDKNKIEQLVSDFIQTRKIPQEILDFYAKHKTNNYFKLFS